jgi:hypothetical protein
LPPGRDEIGRSDEIFQEIFMNGDDGGSRKIRRRLEAAPSFAAKSSHARAFHVATNFQRTYYVWRSFQFARQISNSNPINSISISFSHRTFGQQKDEITFLQKT